MKSSISATEAKQNFGEIFGKVAFGKEHITVEKQKKPLMVMIPMETYDEYLLLKLKKDRPSPRQLLEIADAFRRRQPLPPKNAPDSVQIIRELRHHERK